MAKVRERIAAAGADPASVRLVAVTKGQPIEAVDAAVRAGVTDLGESYPQELVAKVHALDDRADMADGSPGPPARWHFIGRLQRNKVKQVAPLVHLWQSIARLSLAAEVAKHAPGAEVLVQVNVAGAEHQGGCAPARLASVVEGCTDLGLVVRGVMAIGAQGPPEEARDGFRTLRRLADRLGLPERSMGMSRDLEVAISEGATMLRIGTALFDPRGGSAAMGN